MKTLLTLSLLLFINNQVFSQKGDWFMGLETGYTSSVLAEPRSLTPDEELDLFNKQNGLHFGIFTEYFFSRKWSAKLKFKYYEVATIRSRTTLTISQGAIGQRERYEADILNIPLFASFHFGKPLLSAHIDLGPAYGIELSGGIIGENPVFEDTSPGFGFGFAIGAESKIISDTIIVFLDYEYYGLDNDINNRAANLGARIKLN